MDALDLEMYLEKETATIVSTIPTLTALRSNSDTRGISDASDNITKVVDQAEPELVHSNSADAKAIKQKMASASFDIAKYAKELFRLIED
ncbi:hypothetical protein BGX34_002564 [Mortierella sp. NVP85]|nr:hypothetical protein BGX34_002564 [Mortierella sp. NVP85]